VAAVEGTARTEVPEAGSYRGLRVLRGLSILAIAGMVLILSARAGWAAEAVLPGVADVEAILNRIKTWIQAIALTFAVVMACVAGVRYLASSDTTGAEKAKSGLRSAAIGLAIVLLAELLVSVAAYFIQGSK
jgi:succinate dehydrogenase/fumarate reductase cytochrome b subunit